MGIKSISLSEYFSYPVYKVDKDGIKIFPKPKIGKIYRKDNYTETMREANVIEVIGLDIRPVQYFDYAYQPEVKKIHIQEYKVAFKKDEIEI